jgi:hypothetical protein
MQKNVGQFMYRRKKEKKTQKRNEKKNMEHKSFGNSSEIQGFLSIGLLIQFENLLDIYVEYLVPAHFNCYFYE